MLEDLIDNDWSWPTWTFDEAETEFVRAYVPEFPGLDFEVVRQQAEMMDIVAARSLIQSLVDGDVF